MQVSLIDISFDDGLKAITYARENTVDVVITDLNMPQITGMSLLIRLKQLESYKFTPVVILTTESSDYVKEKAKIKGAAGWISQPITEQKVRVMDKVFH